MTAIFNAFNRHEIACDTPIPQNRGCTTGPNTAPTYITATPGEFKVNLDWTPVTDAYQYYIYRTEGPKGCDFGKIKLGTVNTPTTEFVDSQTLNCRAYYYAVQAVAQNKACFGPLSSCVEVIPGLCVSSIEPSSGCANGGYYVTISGITGIGFQPEAEVFFGDFKSLDVNVI